MTCGSVASSPTAAAIPGYGSHMRWHPASGVGIVAFGNARYAPISQPAREAFTMLVERGHGRVRPIVSWPETLAAKAAVEAPARTMGR